MTVLVKGLATTHAGITAIGAAATYFFSSNSFGAASIVMKTIIQVAIWEPWSLWMVVVMVALIAIYNGAMYNR
ncbi:hypothetical protein E5D57_012342 [Metarhizium anisopliae]|nr:hypothetical protein E5D57_012342 [Metarhizium anisopliae]